jgi:hypothetical protein
MSEAAVQIVKLLLSVPATRIDQTDDFGISPLAIAIESEVHPSSR